MLGENLSNKLGLGALSALVLGSMIGAGVFSLPQNMAAVASPLAVTIGWVITGVGMVFLALAFQALSHARPDINTGVFGYAKAGFGDLVGFFSAWGYWLSAALANVSYLVIVFSTLGMFFDTPNHVIFGEGNTVISVAAATVMVWAVHLLVHRGVQTAAVINMVTTVAKMIPLLILIGGLIYAFSTQTFFWDFSGLKTFPGKSLIEQVKGTMLVTVWVFIGIEGAVVVSSRAKDRKDVGRATIIGLLTALSIYVLVTLLSMGVIKTLNWRRCKTRLRPLYWSISSAGRALSSLVWVLLFQLGGHSSAGHCWHLKRRIFQRKKECSRHGMAIKANPDVRHAH